MHGASTALLVEKMRDAAKAKGIEAIIDAYSYTALDPVIDSADIVLLGPQLRVKKDALKTKYADKNVPIEVIETSDYGMLRGEKVLEKALNTINK